MPDVRNPAKPTAACVTRTGLLLNATESPVDTYGEMVMKHVSALVAALVLNAVANLCMKMGMKSVEAGGGLLAGGAVGAIRSILTSPVLLGGLICFAANAFLYMYALQSRALKISLAYPLMVGGGYAIIAVVAALSPNLRERLSAGQWLGVAFILVGVILVAVLTPADAAA